MNSRIQSIALSVIGVAVIVLFVLFFTRSEKLAYIDTSKLLEQSKEMQKLKKDLLKEKELAKSNLDTLSNEFQNDLKKYEKDQARMTGKEKSLSQELLKNKQQQLVQYQQALQEKMQQDEQKKTQELLVNINAKIKEYGESKNYKLILATAGGNIAYGDKGVDITDEIVLLINK